MFFKRSRVSQALMEDEAQPSRLVSSASARPTSDAIDERIGKIASASIALSKLAPRLAQLATEMAEGAALQARESTMIAEQASSMSEELESSIKSLKVDSGKVGGIVGSIRKLADQSKILAVNASIEAANAGIVGRAFGAVAVEVESLAGRTSKATDDVNDKISMIEKSIQRAVEAAGLGGDTDRFGMKRDQSQSIRGLGEKVDSIASVARQNSASATSVAEAGREVRSLCESLLLTVGRFRIQPHQRAARIFDEFVKHGSIVSFSPLRVEQFLEEKVVQFPMFEVLYLTDARGVQVTENVWAEGHLGKESAKGRNWSGREWFQAAVNAAGQTSISDIYHSVATDSYCFTLSRGIFSPEGELKGVLAADVNFASLLDIR